ncbi:4-chlorobenzoate--CoA ligase [Rhynchospora pubera]|uniref:4-chlorobenzoate--CoA ligase n=1 Tax=Rhynchospora pubera TaxID=906938 RepID=A0AAV8FFR0_9POAL|nr:4-chlorobenzoate--CoA ligase [Rhynchospora pubera]
MLEEAIPSLWTSLLSWFTPTVFFVLLNIVIGTIAMTSKGSAGVAASSAGEHHHGHASALKRAPSLVLDRLRSLNLSSYAHHEIPSETGHLQSELAPAGGVGGALTRAPSLVLDRLRSFNLHRFVSGEVQAESVEVEVEPVVDVVSGSDLQVEEHEHYSDHHIERTQSDARPPVPKLPTRMKKSASDKSAFSHFEEAEIPKQPTLDEDGEVDARADDFINKFRNQLRLQRLDSIIRYKEMLTRSAGN